MTGERMGPDDRAEAYLDGELSREEAVDFERDLALRPEVAEALGAAIVLRDLLGRLPPLAPPAGLEERIADALGLATASERSGPGEAEAEGRSAAGLRAALSGSGRFVRSSASAMLGGLGGARPIAAGLGQVRWALGPLGARRTEPAPRRAAWRRVLGGLGKLGGLG